MQRMRQARSQRSHLRYGETMTFYQLNQATKYSVVHSNPKYGQGAVEVASFLMACDALYFARTSDSLTVVHMGRIVVGSNGETPVYK